MQNQTKMRPNQLLGLQLELLLLLLWAFFSCFSSFSISWTRRKKLCHLEVPVPVECAPSWSVSVHSVLVHQKQKPYCFQIANGKINSVAQSCKQLKMLNAFNQSNSCTFGRYDPLSKDFFSHCRTKYRP